MKVSTNKFLRRVSTAAALLIVLLFIIYLPLQADVAKDEQSRKSGQTIGESTTAQFVTLEYKADAKNDETIIDVREKALEEAKDEALLKAAESDVAMPVLLREKPRLLRVFAKQRDSLIEEMKIHSEAEREGRSYWVRLTAKVNGALLKDLLMKNLQEDRVVVVTSEKNFKQPLKRHILEHDLIAGIKKKGYAIVDYRTIKNDKVSALVSAVRQGNTKAVQEMGLYYLTDVVVVGFVETRYSQQTQDIHSAYVNGQVKIHKIGSRKELASVTRHSVKGFGSDPERAGLDAIRKISPIISTEALKGLPVNKLQSVKLYLREVDHYVAYQKAKSFLGGLSSVRKISEGTRDFQQEEATIYMWITGSVDTLVEQITELKKFVVTEVRNSEIFLTARKLN